MYHLKCKCMLYSDENFILGEGRADLLKLIDKKGSISSAAQDMKMSYRHAWGEIKEIEEVTGNEILTSTRGGEERGGSKLTEFAHELLKEFEELKEEHEITTYKKPSLTVDGIIKRKNKILLIKRRNPPFQGMYALPGGFVEFGERVENAVVREIEEETGLKTEINKLIGVYSDPNRDPRGHTVSTVFHLKPIGGELEGGSDAADAEYFDVGNLPELAFDHDKIIEDFLEVLEDE